MITRRPGLIFAALAVATLSLLALRVASHSETRPASSWIVPERWALDCTHEGDSRRPTVESAAAVRECELRENLRSLAVKHQRCSTPKECLVLRKIRTLDCGVPLSKRSLESFLAQYRELHDQLSEVPSRACRQVSQSACADGWCVASDVSTRTGVASDGASL
jgi:hypothetical protein